MTDVFPSFMGQESSTTSVSRRTMTSGLWWISTIFDIIYKLYLLCRSLAWFKISRLKSPSWPCFIFLLLGSWAWCWYGVLSFSITYWHGFPPPLPKMRLLHSKWRMINRLPMAHLSAFFINPCPIHAVNCLFCPLLIVFVSISSSLILHPPRPKTKYYAFFCFPPSFESLNIHILLNWVCIQHISTSLICSPMHRIKLNFTVQ